MNPRPEALQIFAAKMNGGGHFFERAVPGALAEPVHAAFDLTGPVLNRGERVGRRHAEVVVAVDRQDRLVDVRDRVLQMTDDAAEFVGEGVAHRVGDVDRRGARVDRGLDHAAEFGKRRAAGVFAGEFHVVRVLRRALDGGDRHVADLVVVLAKLVANVDFGGGDEGVDAAARGDLERFAAGVDVLFDGPRETAGDGAGERRRDRLDALEVAVRRDGESRLDHVDTELFERLGDLQLLPQGKALLKRLFAVSKGGVENYNVIGILCHGDSVEKVPRGTLSFRFGSLLQKNRYCTEENSTDFQPFRQGNGRKKLENRRFDLGLRQVFGVGQAKGGGKASICRKGDFCRKSGYGSSIRQRTREKFSFSSLQTIRICDKIRDMETVRRKDGT